MIDFLIKSTISLIVFLGFYHLVLEREKTLQLNRFYLLSSIVISLAIPFITFEIIKIVPVVQEINPAMPPFPTSFEKITPETLDYTPFILWSIYGITTFLLLLRFGKNFWKLLSKSNSNTIVKYKNATLVLVDEKALPHTFLNSIFINSDDYNNRNIEEELYTHELVHVNQKHTLDILFIELLKVIFWFNPLFIFYKKAIQLNHEFLADEKVVTSYNDIPFYQSLLLQKSSGNQNIYLASNLNYLVTKKRLLMMTKNTSKRIAFLNKIAIVPILAGLIYFFCIEIVAQEKTISVNQVAVSAVAINDEELLDSSAISDKRRDAYYASVRILVKDYSRDIKIDKMYEDLSLEEKRRYLNYVPKAFQKKFPTEKELLDFKNAKKYAIWIDEIHVTNNKLNDFEPKEIAYFSGSVVLKNARSKRFPQPYQYSFYTNDYFNKNLKNSHLKFSNDTLRIGISDYNRTKNLKKLKLIKADTLARYAQEKQEDKIYNTSETTENPEFEGGMTAFFKYISAHFKIPEEVTKSKLKGKVYASFIIEKDGSLSNIKILKEMGYGTREEAERVLKNSPKWKPGKIHEKSVRTLYSLPIVIASE
jgi:hypothetical protein